MTMIVFTKREAGILFDRLSAPDAVAEALTDTHPDDEAPSYTCEEALVAAEKLGTEINLFRSVNVETQLDRDVIADAVDGSVFPYFIDDSYEDGDMTAAERGGWIATLRRIERKLAKAGIEASFPRG